ncbi:MAG: formylmethanofuran dehydrogenase, partial [Methanothrix sp.]
MNSLRLKAAAGQLSADEKKEMEGLRTLVIDSILSGRDEDLLAVSEADIPEPEKGRIYPSIACQE